MANKDIRRKSKYTDAQLDQLADKMLEYIDSTDFPLIISCELHCDLYDGELQDIARRCKFNERFCGAYIRLEAKQKEFLAIQGLKKQHDSSLTKFFLSCCHGMTEKTHVVQETIESCIRADEDEVARAEDFESSRPKKVEV